MNIESDFAVYRILKIKITILCVLIQNIGTDFANGET